MHGQKKVNKETGISDFKKWVEPKTNATVLN